MTATEQDQSVKDRPNYLRFGLGQIFVLFFVLAILAALIAPRIRTAYRSVQIDRRSRQLEATYRDLDAAVRNGNAGLAKAAIEAGADPNMKRGESYLRGCIERGHLEVMALLLSAGADLETNERLQGGLTAGGPPLFAAIVAPQPTTTRLNMLKMLIDAGADPLITIGGRSGMSHAVKEGNTQIADLLRKHGLDYGPREMVAFNRLDEVRPIVEQNPEILRQRFSPIYGTDPGLGPTLLGTALWHGHREIAYFLIEQGAPLDMVEGLASTPVHLAAKGGDPELIRLLVSHGVDVNTPDSRHDTPLLDCVWHASPEVVSALIESGADVNAQRFDGKTSLHLAASRNRSRIVQLILDAGADPSLTDRDGKTAADVAAPAIVELLR